jgi:Putative ER transporter, 6TM, N-terminal
MFVFFFIGVVVLVYIRGRTGPGPLVFAIVFGNITLGQQILDAFAFIPFIALQIYVSQPLLYFLTRIIRSAQFSIFNVILISRGQIGQAIVVPMAIKSGISILFSAILFPSTISSLFADRCHAVVLPLISVLSEHRNLLKTSTSDEEFSAGKIKTLVSQAEAALAPVAATLHSLKRDIIWSRVNPAEFGKLHEWIRKLVIRADGMSVYFSLIDPTRERFPVSPAPSHPATPIGVTPYPSRPPSPDEANRVDQIDVDASRGLQNLDLGLLTAEPEQVDTIPLERSIPRVRHAHTRDHSDHHHHHHQHHLSHGSLLHLALSRPTVQQPSVGVFETRRYANLEAQREETIGAEDQTGRFHALLGDSCNEMLEICGEALNGVGSWLDTAVSHHRFHFWRNKSEVEKSQKDSLSEIEKTKQKVDEAVENFRNEKRYAISNYLLNGFIILTSAHHIGTLLLIHIAQFSIPNTWLPIRVTKCPLIDTCSIVTYINFT